MLSAVAMDAAATPAVVTRPHLHEWPAELQLLLGPDAEGLLAVAVEAFGARLSTWSSQHVTHHPGRSTTVSYRALVEWPDGANSTETLVAALGDGLPEGAALVGCGSTRVALWRWPVDPSLPGLASALDRHKVATLLEELGAGAGHVQLSVRSYRPGRRAVVEATGRQGRLFLKVVRPSRAADLHRTHRMLSPRLPVPDSLGWSDEGIVVLEALPGRTLRQVLHAARSTPPAPSSIELLLDALPDALIGHGRRDLTGSLDRHAQVLGSALPAVRATALGLVDDLVPLLRTDHPVVAVHGDLYESQLMVRNGRICGLLDIDTAGGGYRVDDIATLCGHLSVLGQVASRARAVRRFEQAMVEHAAARYQPADLFARIAVSVIGLATGPFRVLDPNWPQDTARRLSLARTWADRADAARRGLNG